MDSQYITDSGLKSERTASRFPINRTYTQEQTIIANDYVFHTPSDWFSSRSPGKCIGLREARLIPWHGVFSIPLLIGDEDHFFEYTAIFRENEDIQDFIRSLERQVQAYLNKNFAGALLLTSYDNGEFRMKFVDNDYDTMPFAIVFDRYDGKYKEEHINNFLL